MFDQNGENELPKTYVVGSKYDWLGNNCCYTIHFKKLTQIFFLNGKFTLNRPKGSKRLGCTYSEPYYILKE